MKKKLKLNLFFVPAKRRIVKSAILFQFFEIVM